MASPSREFVDYIANARAGGVADEEIRQGLQAAGWSAQDIDAAFAGDSFIDSFPKAPVEKRLPRPFGFFVIFRKPIVAGLGAFLVLGGLGGAYLYFFLKPPETFAREAAEKFFELSSYHSESELKITVQTAQPTGAATFNENLQTIREGRFSATLLDALPGTFALHRTTRLAQFDAQELIGSEVPQGSLTLTAKGIADVAQAPVYVRTFQGVPNPSATADSIGRFQLDGEIATEFTFGDFRGNASVRGALRAPTDKDLYFQIRDFRAKVASDRDPEVSVFSGAIEGAIANVSGKWFHVDISDFRETLHDASDVAPLTADEENRLTRLFLDAVVFERLDDEKVDGVKTDVYRFTIRPEQYEVFIRESTRIISDRQGTSFDANTIALQEDEKALLRNMQGKVWIGRKDVFVRRLEMKAPFSFENDSMTGELFVSATYSQFNEPLKAESPQDALPLSQFSALIGFDDLFEESFFNSEAEGLFESAETPWGGSLQRGRDARRLSDLQMLALAAELYFDQHRQYPSNIMTLQPIDVELCPPLVGGGIIPECPREPAAPERYYGYRSDGQSYELSTVLEDCSRQDLSLRRVGELCIFVIQQGPFFANQ